MEMLYGHLRSTEHTWNEDNRAAGKDPREDFNFGPIEGDFRDSHPILWEYTQLWESEKPAEEQIYNQDRAFGYRLKSWSQVKTGGAKRNYETPERDYDCPVYEHEEVTTELDTETDEEFCTRVINYFNSIPAPPPSKGPPAPCSTSA